MPKIGQRITVVCFALSAQVGSAQDAPHPYSSVEPIDPFAPKTQLSPLAPAVVIPTVQQVGTAAIAAPPVPLNTAVTLAAQAPGRQIHLTEPVVVQERPFFHGSSYFAAGGLVGGLVSAAISKDEPERIASFVRQKNIHFDELVRAEFERQINANGHYITTYHTFGPASFRLNAVYGITSVPFSAYRPYFSINAELVDANGVIKWKNRDYIGARGKAAVIPYEKFLESEDVFRSEFNTVIEEVVGLILKDFHS